MIDRLGKYRVTEVLGEGAMGIVYRAFDPDIRRQVALKTMRALGPADGVSGVSPADRFRNEARAAGRLQHPGIIQIYEIGEWRPEGSHAPMPFFSLEYCRGGSLAVDASPSGAELGCHCGGLRNGAQRGLGSGNAPGPHTGPEVHPGNAVFALERQGDVAVASIERAQVGAGNA